MQVQQNFSLISNNTFGINAYAEYFSQFHSVEELKEILNNYKNISQKMILGGGSNILFTKNYEGLILKNNIEGIEIIRESEDEVFIKVGAGVNWHQFVLFCVNQNLGGAENLSLIPGNVGASPMQNIGAYGVEIKDLFFELNAMHLKEQTLTTFSNKDCNFGYRDSVFKNQFKNQFIIADVTYRLKKNPTFNISYGAIETQLEKMNLSELSVKAISDAIIKIRTSKLPNPQLIGNAGSFFKNPVVSYQEWNSLIQLKKLTNEEVPFYKIDDAHYKIPAGWLIEQCGWKGYRKGDVGCYEKQALVLVNYGNASGKEIFNLSTEIIISVKEKFGISLEREVNVV
jgi:UDP-N-acetylmuramate dehydrogenase